jgi:hypothetical protein
MSSPTTARTGQGFECPPSDAGSAASSAAGSVASPALARAAAPTSMSAYALSYTSATASTLAAVASVTISAILEGSILDSMLLPAAVWLVHNICPASISYPCCCTAFGHSFTPL